MWLNNFGIGLSVVFCFIDNFILWIDVWYVGLLLVKFLENNVVGIYRGILYRNMFKIFFDMFVVEKSSCLGLVDFYIEIWWGYYGFCLMLVFWIYIDCYVFVFYVWSILFNLFWILKEFRWLL